jgi:hypothetical protein
MDFGGKVRDLRYLRASSGRIARGQPLRLALQLAEAFLGLEPMHRWVRRFRADPLVLPRGIGRIAFGQKALSRAQMRVTAQLRGSVRVGDHLPQLLPHGSKVLGGPSAIDARQRIGDRFPQMVGRGFRRLFDFERPMERQELVADLLARQGSSIDLHLVHRAPVILPTAAHGQRPAPHEIARKIGPHDRRGRAVAVDIEPDLALLPIADQRDVSPVAGLNGRGRRSAGRNDLSRVVAVAEVAVQLALAGQVDHKIRVGVFAEREDPPLVLLAVDRQLLGLDPGHERPRCGAEPLRFRQLDGNRRPRRAVEQQRASGGRVGPLGPHGAIQAVPGSVLRHLAGAFVEPPMDQQLAFRPGGSKPSAARQRQQRSRDSPTHRYEFMRLSPNWVPMSLTFRKRVGKPLACPRCIHPGERCGVSPPGERCGVSPPVSSPSPPQLASGAASAHRWP